MHIAGLTEPSMLIFLRMEKQSRFISFKIDQFLLPHPWLRRRLHSLPPRHLRLPPLLLRPLRFRYQFHLHPFICRQDCYHDELLWFWLVFPTLMRPRPYHPCLLAPRLLSVPSPSLFQQFCPSISRLLFSTRQPSLLWTFQLLQQII